MSWNPAVRASLWARLVFAALLVTARSQSWGPPQTGPPPKPYQPLSTTPLPPVNNSGTFLWPNTTVQQIFDAGSLMNISWKSPYKRFSILAIPNLEWTNPVTLQTNISDPFFVWNATCGNQCDHPWMAHVVNAEGSQNEQENGGFVSAMFWIRGKNAVANNTSTSSTDSGTNASPSASASGSGSKGLSTGASVGIGIGAALGVGLLAAAAGFLFFWLRRHKQPAPPAPHYAQAEPQPPMADSRTRHELSPQSAISELPTQKTFHEAPGWYPDPQELPASPERYA